MLSNLGFYSLVFGLITSFVIIFKATTLIKNNKNNFIININYLLFFQLFFVLLSFVFLLCSFILSDFSNITVYNYSHTTKPLFYKISGLWGNHEGSLLLWLLVLTSIIFIFVCDTKSFDSKYKLYTILFHEIIVIGFFLFILFTSNPFEIIFPIPNEGLGLNPILQDPALAIHPPVLYLGYVGTSIIFSASLSAIINKNVTQPWAKHIKKWTFISWIFLTLGIMLGSIWAYYELGWGGFWFWDPVENVSLMPWLCLTALLHCVLVLEKRNSLKNWTILLSIATFALSMSGTFLVRSGILNSVHTFANDPSRGVFILVFLLILILMAISIYFIFSSEEVDTKSFYWFSKETAVLINNWFMMYFLSVVLIGTVYPIFLEVITNKKISVGPPFYQKLLVPFLVPFLLFMAIGPKLKWIRDKISSINYKILFIVILTFLLAYLIMIYSSVKYLFATILIAMSIFLFFISFSDLFREKIQLPQKITHFSFSVLILSILLNGIFSKEINSNMKVGDELKFVNKIIKFKSIDLKEEKNYKALLGNFEITETGKYPIDFRPEIRIYNQPIISTSEADIRTNLISDNFIVFSLLKDEETFNVRYQFKPLMLLIWISSFFMAIGGVLAILKK